MMVRLREVTQDDLPIFFEQQLDPVANHMAAFIGRDPTDRTLFEDHWRINIFDGITLVRTILSEDQVAGYILSYEHGGEREISYWLGREHWGQGIATAALRLFLDIEQRRPLHARAAKDNLGSLRVLHKCGFRIVGEDKGFAKARGEEVEEHCLILASPPR